MTNEFEAAQEIVGAIRAAADDLVGALMESAEELRLALDGPARRREDLICQITCALLAGGVEAADDNLSLQRQDCRAALVRLAGLLADQVVVEAAGRGPTGPRPEKS